MSYSDFCPHNFRKESSCALCVLGFPEPTDDMKKFRAENPKFFGEEEPPHAETITQPTKPNLEQGRE